MCQFSRLTIVELSEAILKSPSISGDGGSSVRAFPTRLVFFGSSLYSSLRRVPLPRRRVLPRLRTASRRSPLRLVSFLRVRVVLSRVGLHLARDSSSFHLPRRRRATLGARLDTMRRICHFGYIQLPTGSVSQNLSNCVGYLVEAKR